MNDREMLCNLFLEGFLLLLEFDEVYYCFVDLPMVAFDWITVHLLQSTLQKSVAELIFLQFCELPDLFFKYFG
mgnify:CR=1 FL=1